MTIIKLYADDQKLDTTLRPCVASGDQSSVEIQVSFTSHWNGYQKSAVFFTALDDTVYEVLLTDGKCIVPHEVLAKATNLFIGVRGVNNGVKTSSLVEYKIVDGAPVGTATAIEPTPDVYQQILTKLSQLENNSGGNGGNGVQGGSYITIGTVNLIAENWNGENNLYSQVVDIDGVTENSQVDLTPSVEQLVVFYQKDLTFVTENDGGVVTVYAIGQKPNNDYTIQVTITEVSV